jgi:RNA polymerase subunit RPABC4/transcription elongation factor Spt4
MKISEINKIIDNVVAEEVRRTIIKESEDKKKEVYHIKCEGVPLATFDTEAEAKENLPHYKAKHKGELIIEKGIYKSQNDMLDKLDEMNDQLEETNDMENTQPMEGNEFSGALKAAKDAGEKSFTVDGKKYDVEECWSKQMEEEECKECSASMEEELHGNQDRIDADNDGKISANDFRLLLKKKKQGDVDEQQGNIAEDEEGQDVYSIWEKYNEAAIKEHDPSTFSDEFEYADNVISHIVQDAIMNGDVDEEDEEELIDELKDTYGYDLFDMFRSGSGEGFEDDEDVDLSDEMNENKGMCSECGGMMNEEGMCNECGGNTMYESKKKIIRLTESELAKLITKMVNESTPGLEAYKKAHRESGKQNKEGIEAIMKDVTKNHINVEGNDKPEFPHQIGKGEKVARKNTKEQDEEVAKNFAGLQNLEYENEPDENFKKRLKMAIEGDKLMGNAPTTEKTNIVASNGAKAEEEKENKNGNSIPTPETGKKIEKQIKDREKDKKERVLYKKEAVPTNESKVSFNNVLLEELNKMKSLSSYNKKTQ